MSARGSTCGDAFWNSLGSKSGQGRVGQDLPRPGIHDQHREGIRPRGGHGRAGDTVHGVLQVDVDGQEDLVAVDGPRVPAQNLGSQLVVERILDAIQGYVVRSHVADHVGGQPALRIESSPVLLHLDAGQLALGLQLSDRVRLLGSDAPLDHRVAVVAAPVVRDLRRVHPQDPGQERRAFLRVADGRHPRGDALLPDADRQDPPLSVQDASPLDFGNHQGLLGLVQRGHHHETDELYDYGKGEKGQNNGHHGEPPAGDDLVPGVIHEPSTPLPIIG